MDPGMKCTCGRCIEVSSQDPHLSQSECKRSEQSGKLKSDAVPMKASASPMGSSESGITHQMPLRERRMPGLCIPTWHSHYISIPAPPPTQWGGEISDKAASFSQEIPRKGHSSEPALANNPSSQEMSSLLLKGFICHKSQRLL